jgi:hypothetical protein
VGGLFGELVTDPDIATVLVGELDGSNWFEGVAEFVPPLLEGVDSCVEDGLGVPSKVGVGLIDRVDVPTGEGVGVGGITVGTADPVLEGVPLEERVEVGVRVIEGTLGLINRFAPWLTYCM